MVYVLKGGPFFKIGYSRNLRGRIPSIQTGCPYPVELVLTIKGASRNDEKRLHFTFQSKRGEARNEWFKLTDKDIALIKEIKIEIEKGSKSKDNHGQNFIDITDGDLYVLKRLYEANERDKDFEFDCEKYEDMEFLVKKERRWRNGVLRIKDLKLKEFYDKIKPIFLEHERAILSEAKRIEEERSFKAARRLAQNKFFQ